MSQALKVRLPVTHILIVDSVDDVLTQDEVRLVGIGLGGQEIRRDEVRFVNGGTLIATANSREHLVSQPCQILFQMAENQRRGEVSRERLMPVQQVLGIS